MRRSDIREKFSAVFVDGELPLLLYISKQDVEERRVARPLHSHDSITEIGVVYKGKGYYHINDKTYRLEEGDIIFYNQNELHEVASGTESEIGTYFLGITGLKLHNLPENHFVRPGGSYVRNAGAIFPFVVDLCEQIYQLDAEPESGEVVAQLLCASMIAISIQLKNFRYANLTGSREDHFASEIKNYLNDHFTEHLSLEIIARDFNCSVSYVSHVFRKATGNTPIQYIIQRRIGMAQNLLISSDLSATEIATRVGYNNTNYFSTLFTKIVGQTPIDYRRNYLKWMRGKRQQ